MRYCKFSMILGVRQICVNQANALLCKFVVYSLQYFETLTYNTSFYR